MKKFIFFSTVILSFNSFAESGSLSLEKFCHTAYTNKVLSDFAIANDGQYQENSVEQNVQMKPYKGCRFDTPWIKNLYETVCDGSRVNALETIQASVAKIKIPKVIMFFFDGASDFNASRAFSLLRPVNLDGSEGNDMAGNGNGLSALNSFLNSTDSAIRKYRNDIELHYHSGSGFKQRENYASAVTCANESKYYLKVLEELKNNSAPMPQWFVMGFSNGGSLTLDFQDDVSVDLAITIDPIVQTSSYLFHKMKSTIGKKNSKTKRLVNYYQSTDKDSLPGFQLRGKPVVGADVNYELTPKNSSLNPAGSYNHLYIVRDDFVLKNIKCEFKNLVGEANQTCNQ